MCSMGGEQCWPQAICAAWEDGSVGHKLRIRAGWEEGRSFGRSPPGGTSCPALPPNLLTQTACALEIISFILKLHCVLLRFFLGDCWSFLLSTLISACLSIIGTCVKIASIYISPPPPVNMAKALYFSVLTEAFNRGRQLWSINKHCFLFADMRLI